jgi:hypothetical protein
MAKYQEEEKNLNDAIEYKTNTWMRHFDGLRASLRSRRTKSTGDG